MLFATFKKIIFRMFEASLGEFRTGPSKVGGKVGEKWDEE